MHQTVCACILQGSFQPLDVESRLDMDLRKRQKFSIMSAILQAFDELAHGRLLTLSCLTACKSRSAVGLWEERDSGTESLSILVKASSKKCRQKCDGHCK